MPRLFPALPLMPERSYCLACSVVCLPAHPLLRTPEALGVVGPAAFGHPELTYQPIGPYKPPDPVPRQLGRLEYCRGEHV